MGLYIWVLREVYERRLRRIEGAVPENGSTVVCTFLEMLVSLVERDWVLGDYALDG